MEKDRTISEIFFMQLNNISCDGKYDEVNDILSNTNDYMLNALKDNEEILKHYKTMTDALDKYNALESKDFYIEGFKFGFKLAMDIFNN